MEAKAAKKRLTPRQLHVDHMDDIKNGHVVTGTTYIHGTHGLALDDKQRGVIWFGGPLSKTDANQRVEIRKEGADLHVQFLKVKPRKKG